MPGAVGTVHIGTEPPPLSLCMLLSTWCPWFRPRLQCGRVACCNACLSVYRHEPAANMKYPFSPRIRGHHRCSQFHLQACCWQPMAQQTRAPQLYSDDSKMVAIKHHAQQAKLNVFERMPEQFLNKLCLALWARCTLAQSRHHCHSACISVHGVHDFGRVYNADASRVALCVFLYIDTNLLQT